jgi:hypothetical protein
MPTQLLQSEALTSSGRRSRAATGPGRPGPRAGRRCYVVEIHCRRRYPCTAATRTAGNADRRRAFPVRFGALAS